MELRVSVFRDGSIDQEDATIRIEGLPQGITVLDVEQVVRPGAIDAVFTLEADRTISALATDFPISVAGQAGAFVDTVEIAVSVEAIVRSPEDSGPGTLRHMIEAALAVGGKPTISFDETMFPTTIFLDSPLVVDEGELTIWGPVPPRIVLDGGGAVRIFEVGPDANLTLVILELRNGYSEDSGGCIHSQGEIKLASVVVSGCLSEINGGGLSADGGKPVRLQDARFEFCTAEWSGGGAFITGPLEAHRTSFDWNTAGLGGGLFLDSWDEEEAIPVNATYLNFQGNVGGGMESMGVHYGRVWAGVAIESLGPSGSGVSLIGPGPWEFEGFHADDNQGSGFSLSATHFTCVECTIERNDAYGKGGGINADASVVTLISSSVVGNQAWAGGGGIWSGKGFWVELPSRLTLINTTIASNELDEGNWANQGAGIRGENSDMDIWFSTIALNDANEGLGGGISSNRQVNLFGTIVAMNRARVGSTWQDWDGGLDTYSSLGYNWIGVADENWNGLHPTDRFGTPQAILDPDLLPPALHDGFTTNMPPRWTSPVIDQIPPALCKVDRKLLSEDQIGTSRPLGTGCDIGAIEYGN